MIRTTFRFTNIAKQFFAAGKVQNIKGTEALNTIIKQSKNNKVLLDFYADWCGPCKSLGPRLQKQVQNNQNLTLAKINIDEQLNSEIVNKYSVRAVPTLVLLKNGQKVQQRTGNLPDSQLQNFLNQ